MPDYPLVVFATSAAAMPLAALRDTLAAAGSPASFGVGIAGEATDEQLQDPDWDAAFLRWLEPEVHEVALIDRMALRVDEEAEKLIGQHLTAVERLPDIVGRMIVADHLSRTRVAYAIQLLPALLVEDSHEAWGALDLLLRSLAQGSDGLIYAEAEGYCDPKGELLLSETDDLYSVDAEQLE